MKVQGGLLEIITRAVEIECLPDDIPEKFVVNVSELMIGQSKRASDVTLSGTTKLVSDPQSVIAHIVALRAEVVATPAEGAVAAAPAAAEPEVVKKGKKDESSRGRRQGKGQEEVARHVPGVRSRKSGRGVCALAA